MDKPRGLLSQRYSSIGYSPVLCYLLDSSFLLLYSRRIYQICHRWLNLEASLENPRSCKLEKSHPSSLLFPVRRINQRCFAKRPEKLVNKFWKKAAKFFWEQTSTQQCWWEFERSKLIKTGNVQNPVDRPEVVAATDSEVTVQFFYTVCNPTKFTGTSRFAPSAHIQRWKTAGFRVLSQSVTRVECIKFVTEVYQIGNKNVSRARTFLVARKRKKERRYLYAEANLYQPKHLQDDANGERERQVCFLPRNCAARNARKGFLERCTREVKVSLYFQCTVSYRTSLSSPIWFASTVDPAATDRLISYSASSKRRIIINIEKTSPEDKRGWG